MEVEFQSRRPHRTLFLFVAHRPDEDEMFQRLERALGLIHWVRDSWEAPALPNGTIESKFHRTGTYIFNGRTAEERARYEPDVRRVLKGFVRGRVPHRKLTMQDCI